MFSRFSSPSNSVTKIHRDNRHHPPPPSPPEVACFYYTPVLHVPSHTTDRIFFSISHHPPDRLTPAAGIAPLSIPPTSAEKKAPGKYRHHPAGLPFSVDSTGTHAPAYVQGRIVDEKGATYPGEGVRGAGIGVGKNSSKIAHGAGAVIHWRFFRQQRANFEKISRRHGCGEAGGGVRGGGEAPVGWLTFYRRAFSLLAGEIVISEAVNGERGRRTLEMCRAQEGWRIIVIRNNYGGCLEFFFFWGGERRSIESGRSTEATGRIQSPRERGEGRGRRGRETARGPREREATEALSAEPLRP